MADYEPPTAAATTLRQHSATILGYADLTALARPHRFLLDPEPAEALHKAMVSTLSWHQTDVYMMATGVLNRPVVARWTPVPLGCSTLAVAPHHDGPLNRVPAWIRVWVSSGAEPRPRVIAEHTGDLRSVPAPYSGVVAAIAWRERYGFDPRTFSLGRHGLVSFVPEEVEYDYRAGIEDGTPRLRRSYYSPALANYTAPFRPRTQNWAVWMWLANKKTGSPARACWRVSELALTPALPTISELGVHHINLDRHYMPGTEPGWPQYVPVPRPAKPPYVPGLLW